MSLLSIAAGGTHYLAIHADGTLWTWGRNSYGELGNGKTRDSEKPVHVAALSEVDAVAGGRDFSLAVKGDGTVWAWGRNDDKLVGGKDPCLEPSQVKGLREVLRVAGEWSHYLALKKDGTVWAWGENEDGRLGTGSTKSSAIPGQVKKVEGAVAIEAGNSFSLALQGDGTVWAWGSNLSGEMGVDDVEQRLIPAPVPGLPVITAIAAKDDHALGLASNGSVWHWGGVSFLDRGPQSKAPKRVAGLTHVAAVALTNGHAVALKRDRTVWACKLDGHRVGAPARVGVVDNVTAIAAASYEVLARVGTSTLMELWFREMPKGGAKATQIASIAKLASQRDKAVKAPPPPKPVIDAALKKHVASLNRQLTKHGGSANNIKLGELTAYQCRFLEELMNERLAGYVEKAAKQLGSSEEPDVPPEKLARVAVHVHKIQLPDQDVDAWELVLGGTAFGGPEVVFSFVGWKQKRAVFVG